jgi:hypothetical protein
MRVCDLSREALERIVSELLAKFEITEVDVEWDYQDVGDCAYRLFEEHGLFAE